MLNVVCEEPVPNYTQKRYDASISNPSDPASSSVKVDVTIVSPIQSTSTHNIALNAKFTPMQAAEISFKEEHKMYDPHSVNLPSGDVFLPFVSKVLVPFTLKVVSFLPSYNIVLVIFIRMP
jgi:hypothetical protein